MQVGERMARKKKAMDFSSLDLNLDALGDWGGDEEKAEKEFIRAAKLNLSPVTWDNAEAAADAVDYDKDYFALLSGRFIFWRLHRGAGLQKKNCYRTGSTSPRWA